MALEVNVNNTKNLKSTKETRKKCVSVLTKEENKLLSKFTKSVEGK